MSKETILIIEDEPDIVELVQYNLEREGYQVVSATDGESGLREARAKRPRLVILDLMLPGMDGLEVCRELRSSDETRALPILMLTAKSEETDVVMGLGVGADDYVAKPFSPRELVARVRALLRRASLRAQAKAASRIENGPLALDSTRFEATVNGKVVPLTRAEFRLLWLLLSHPGRVYARSDLVDAITAGETIIVDRNVDVHVSAVRKKLGPAADLIATVRGVGYKCRD